MLVTRAWVLSAALLVLGLAAFPEVVQAQEPRVRIAMTAAAATLDEEADFALGGSVGYRFARGFWFEGEVTWIDQGRRPAGALAIPYPLPPDPPVSGHPADGTIPGGSDVDPVAVEREGTVLVGTMGLRYELPVETERFRPYLAGGLGLNQSDEEMRLTESGAVLEKSTHTGYAFNAGAGVGVRLIGQLWADLDARYFRLSRNRNSMRLGGGLSIRF